MGAQRARRHVRLRRGVLRRDARCDRDRGRRDLRPDGAPVRPLDRHRRGGRRARVHRGRPGLRGDEPQGAAAHPPGAGRRPRCHRALPDRRTRPGRPACRARPGGGGRRAQLRGPRPLRRRVPADPGPAAQQVHLVRHRPGLRGVPVLRQADGVGHHADPRLPLLRRRVDVHRRDARGRLAPGRAGPDRGHRLPARRLRRLRRRAGPRDLRRRAPGPRGPDQQLEVAQLPHRPQRALARRQRRAGRRRRPHRPLLDRLRHQARDGGRAGAGRLPARAADRRGGARGLPGGAQAGRRVDPARRAGVPGVVREHRHVRRPGPGAVRLQPDHAVAPDHLREPQGPRPRVRRPDGVRVRPTPGGRPWMRASRRCSSRRGSARCP